VNIVHVVTLAFVATAASGPSLVVSLKGLDLSRPADVRVLHGRIGNAAWRVCSELIPPNNGPSGIENARCRRALMDDAVAEVNNPALTAYHTKARLPVTARR
jgi:UrcA family protein